MENNTQQPTETPTPRTDEESGDACEMSGYAQVVSSDFARQLERELTAAQAEIARLKEAGEKMKSAIKAKWGGSHLSVCQCRDCQALAAWEKLK